MVNRYIMIRMIGVLTVALAFLSIPASGVESDARDMGQAFHIDDYFKLNQIRELALSSDGRMIAYVVETQSLEENRGVREIHVRRLDTDTEANLPEQIQSGRSFSWIPRRNVLAFLAEEDGITQVFSYDPFSQKVEQQTSGQAHVIRFRFAPNGQSLAYITDKATLFL